MNQLDLWAGMLAIIASSATGCIHIMSDPDRKSWVTMPWYVRLGGFGCAVWWLLRGVDLITLASNPSGRGHADWVGAESWAWTAFYTSGSVLAWFFIARRRRQRT